MKRSLLLALAAILFVPVSLRAQLKTDDKIRIEKDIVYGKGGGRDLKLDLYLPSNGNGPFPGVVCVHGGAWRGGNYRESYIVLTAKLLASRGYVAASVQYRLVREAKFPAQIEDCKCAVRWLRANAEKYKLDSDRIGAVGYSAGGHLVAMLGLTTKEDALEGDGGHSQVSSEVQAVVDFFGPIDLRGGDQPGRTTLRDLIGGTVQEKPEAYAKASPITYIRKERSPAAFLLIHGTNDPLVSIQQSIKLDDALKAAGKESRLVKVEGGGHGWGGERLQQTAEEMIKFFDGRLKTGIRD